MLRIGPFELYSVLTGTFRLDGGAMFGVVPKVLWQAATEVDEQNRIYLATRSLLAVDRDARRVLLVDTGCGTKWSPDAAARYAIRHDAEAIPRALAGLNLTENDITDVIVTHLHFDHNGGLTLWEDDPGGATRLVYPRARHWIHRRQWDHALSPTVKDRGSYLPEDYAALADAGVLHIVEGDDPPPPFAGMSWRLSHGHTPYQLHPCFAHESAALLWTGDVVPTVAHLRLPWVMAYDLFPLTTIEEKTGFARGAIQAGVVLALPHDPRIAAVRLDGTVERPVVTESVAL